MLRDEHGRTSINVATPRIILEMGEIKVAATLEATGVVEEMHLARKHMQSLGPLNISGPRSARFLTSLRSAILIAPPSGLLAAAHTPFLAHKAKKSDVDPAFAAPRSSIWGQRASTSSVATAGVLPCIGGARP